MTCLANRAALRHDPQGIVGGYPQGSVFQQVRRIIMDVKVNGEIANRRIIVGTKINAEKALAQVRAKYGDIPVSCIDHGTSYGVYWVAP